MTRLFFAVTLASLACVVDGFNTALLGRTMSSKGPIARDPVRHGLLAATLSSSVCDRPLISQRMHVVEATQKKRRPNGYWKVFDNVETEIRKIVVSLDLQGMMPTEAQLRKNNLSSLSDALKEHGGFAAVASKLGLRTSKPKGYWSDFSNVVKELEEFMQDRGDILPTQEELRKAGRTDLISGMQVHGGMSAFAEHFGYNMAEHKIRQTGYSVKRRLENEVHNFVNQHGTPGVMPTMQLLMSWGRDDLVRGVDRHGGVEACARKFGLEIKRADGELEHIGRDLKEIAVQLGQPAVLPTVRDLTRMGRGDLAVQIEKRGYNECANLLGMRVAETITSLETRTISPMVQSSVQSKSTVMQQLQQRSASAWMPFSDITAVVRANTGRGVAVAVQGTPRAAVQAARSKKSESLTPGRGAKEMSDMRERMKSRIASRAAAAPRSSVYDALM